MLTAYADANFEMQYVVEEDLPEAFDLDALYHKYYVAPVNAVCNEDTYEVTDGSDGYGFDIKKAMDELEKAGPGRRGHADARRHRAAVHEGIPAGEAVPR